MNAQQHTPLNSQLRGVIIARIATLLASQSEPLQDDYAIVVPYTTSYSSRWRPVAEFLMVNELTAACVSGSGSNEQCIITKDILNVLSDVHLTALFELVIRRNHVQM